MSNFQFVVQCYNECINSLYEQNVHINSIYLQFISFLVEMV